MLSRFLLSTTSRILESKFHPITVYPYSNNPIHVTQWLTVLSLRLVNILKAAGQPVPEELLKFGTTVKKKTHSTYGAFFKDVDMSQKGTKITFD